jgi:hypothetical protein
MHFAELFVIFGALAFGGLVAAMAARYPMALFALLVIWISFAWRVVSISYIDLFGPLYAYQIYEYVGGSAYAPVFALACATVVAPFFLFFGDRGARHLADCADERLALDDPAARQAGGRTFADLVALAAAALAVLLFVTMLLKGPVPIFAGIEQADYKGEAASFLHNLYMPYQMIVTFFLGAVFAHHKIRTGRFHAPMIAACVLLLFYAFLTGNRFSYFFSFTTQFLAPLAAAIGVLSVRSGVHRKPWAWLGATFTKNQLRFGAVFLLLIAGGVGAALVNSYFNIRFSDSDWAQQALLQRILVQPTELTWMALDRVFRLGNVDGWAVLDFVFAHPIDPLKNTSPQYLMLRTVGSQVTFHHLAEGAQFAGGFPGVLFEALGPYWVWPLLLALGFLTAGLSFLIVRAIALGHFLTVAFGAYVLFGILVMYIGGMLNFAMQWTYFVKVAVFCLALAIENAAHRRGIAFIPWYLAEWPAQARRLLSGLGGFRLGRRGA